MRAHRLASQTTALQVAKITFGGFGLVAIIMAWALQPMLPYAEPVGLLVGCMALSMGILFGYFRVIWPEAQTDYTMPAGLVCLAVIVLFVTFLFAGRASHKNEVRCAAIQHDMLSSDLRRADDAAMMQALGCVPKGSEMPVYPAAGGLPTNTSGHADAAGKEWETRISDTLRRMGI